MMIHRTTGSAVSSEGTLGGPRRASQISFRASEVFLGSVEKVLPEGSVLISAKGKRFFASTGVNLKEGVLYAFKVEATHPGIVLKTVQSEIDRVPGTLEIWVHGRAARERLAGILQDLAHSHRAKGVSAELRSEMRKLQDLLPSVLYPTPDRADGKWLERAFMSSGIFWEQKLFRHLRETGSPRERPALHFKDLKGLLTRILAAFDNLEAKDDKALSLMGKAREALSFIEDQQLLNVHGGENGWYWFLPGEKGAGLRYAEFSGSRSRATEEHQVHFMVEFSRLGPLEVDLSLSHSGLKASLRAEDEHHVKAICEHLAELEEGLRKAGIGVCGLECVLMKTGGLPNFVLERQSSAIDVMI